MLEGRLEMQVEKENEKNLCASSCGLVFESWLGWFVTKAYFSQVEYK
jgi:hypothetical protein